MMRDKRMSSDYFNSYIDYQEDRISKKTAKLSDGNGDGARLGRINQSLLSFKMDMVYAQFSVGTGKDKLSNYLEDAINAALKVSNIDYETLLNLLSLSVMIGTKNVSSELIVKYRDIIQNDKILNCFASYIDSAKIVWEGDFIIKGLYDSLDKLATANDKEQIMNTYLSNWYILHKDFSWYDSHKNGKDTYVGYWSFESAALAKVMGIDENKLKGNEYYPLL
jgi:hypothetical protein